MCCDVCVAVDCPNKCSNHGKCVSLSQMAREDNSLPLFVVNPASNGLYGDVKVRRRAKTCSYNLKLQAGSGMVNSSKFQ